MVNRFLAGAVSLLLLVSVLSFSGRGGEDEGYTQNPLKPTNLYYRLATKYLKSGKPDSAQIFLRKAEVQLRNEANYQHLVFCLYSMASAQSAMNNFPNALRFATAADSVINYHKLNHPLWADILYLQGNVCFKMNDFDRSLQLFQNCLNEHLKTKAPDSTLARVYTRKATVEYYQGNYSQAIESFTNSVNYGKKAFGPHSLFVSDQVNNQGVINLMMARYDEALANFQQSEQLMKDGKNTTPFALAGTYTNIGLIFKIRNDFSNALLFFNKALDLYLSDLENGKQQIANTYINIAVVYQRQNNLPKQLEFLQKGLTYSEKYFPVLLPKIYWQLAAYYSDVKCYTKAEVFHQKAIQKNRELFGNGPALASVLNNYGEFNMYYTGNLNKALLYYNKALPLYLQLYGNRHPSTAGCLRNVGEVYFLKKDYKNALHYYHEALIAVSDKFNNTDVATYPSLEQSLDDSKFTEILKSKAKTFCAIANDKKNNGGKNIIREQALLHYLAALKMVDKIRLGYENDESRVFLSENEQDTYFGAINAAMDLYKGTKNAKYLEQAFIIADKAHASSLQSAVHEKKLIENLAKTDTILFREFQIKKDLAMYNEFYTKQKISQHPDSAKLRLWSHHINSLTLKLEQHKVKIKKYNPAYYQLKYNTANNKVISNLRNNISQNEAVIEYYFTGDKLLTFCLTRDSIAFQSQIIDDSFGREIEKVLSFVREPRVYSSDSVLCINYRQAAFKLYQMLLSSFSNMIKNKEITIVPDGMLVYLPFETLLTQPTIDKPYSFKQLPYLIRQNSIRYLYAADLLNVKRSQLNSSKIVAFVPNYQSSAEHQLAVQGDSRGAFSNLTQTLNEAKAMVSCFSGKIFSNLDASEDNFKKYAPTYGTILLAMHAVIDDENPLNSRLVFTSNSSKKEDDLLYTYETYNLSLKADLIILSACNTGVGKLRKGEGLMSLTRGFSFAGVQSLVMTLWSVNDNSSSELMKRFYNRLSSSTYKDIALRDAKIDYIQNTDIIHAHPYFWAGYVLIGDNGPIKSSNPMKFLWFLVIIPLTISGWLIYRMLKKRSAQF